MKRVSFAVFFFLFLGWLACAQQAVVQLTAPGRVWCTKSVNTCSMPITAATNGNQYDFGFMDHVDGTGAVAPLRFLTAFSDCDDAHFVGSDPIGSCSQSLNTWILSGPCPGSTCTIGYHTDTGETDSVEIAYCAYPCVGGAKHIVFTRSGNNGLGENYGGVFGESSFTGGPTPSTPVVNTGSNSIATLTQTMTSVALPSGATGVIFQVIGLAGSFKDPITVTPPYNANLYDDVHFNAAIAPNVTSGASPVWTTSNAITASGAGIAHYQQPVIIPGQMTVLGGVHAFGGVVVNQAAIQVQITSTSPLPLCTQSIPFSYTFNALGGVLPYTWTKFSGALQPGLSLSTAGVLSGSCSNSSGVTTAVIQVCDSSPIPGCAQGTFQQTAQGSTGTLYVCDLTSSPTTCPNPPAAGIVGTFLSYNFNAGGGTVPYTWAITSGQIPLGLSLSSSGLFSGFPSTAGVYSFTAQVTDSSTPTPQTASANFTVTISGFNGNPAVALEPQSWTTGYQGGQNLTTGNPCAQTDASGTCARNLPQLCDSGHNCKHEQLGFGTNDHPATLLGLYQAGCEWTQLAQNQYMWVEVKKGSVLSGAAPYTSALFGNPNALYVSPVKMAGLKTPMPTGSSCAMASTTPIGPYTLAGSVTSGPFLLGEQLCQQTSNACANLLYVTCTLGSGSNPAPWIAGSTGGISAVLPNCADAGDAQIGPFSLGMFTGGSPDSNNAHLWIGQTSGSVFTQSAQAATNGYFRLTTECDDADTNIPCNGLADQVPCFHGLLDSTISYHPLCDNDLPSMFTIEATTIANNNSNQIEQDGENTFLSGFEVTFQQGQNQSLTNTACPAGVNCTFAPQIISVDCGSCGRDHYWVHGWDPGDPALHPGDPSQLSFSQAHYPVTPGTSPAQYNCPGWAFFSTNPPSTLNPPVALSSSAPAPYNQVQYANGCGDDVRAGISLNDGGYSSDEYYVISKIHDVQSESHNFGVSNGASNLNPNCNGINGPHLFAQFYQSGTSESGQFFGGTPVNPICGITTDEYVHAFRIAPDPAYRFLTGGSGHSPQASGGWGCGQPAGTGPNICPFVWGMKKNYELKWGKHALLDGFILENMWPDGQTGEIATMDVRVCSGGDDCGIFNPDGTPMTQTNDVTLSNFIMRNSAGGLTVSPRSGQPGNGGGISQGQNRVHFFNGLIYNLDQVQFGGSKGGDALIYGGNGNTFVNGVATRTSNIASISFDVGTVAPNPLSHIQVCGTDSGGCPAPGGVTIPNGSVYVNFNGQREDPLAPTGTTGPCLSPDGVTVILCGTLVFSGGPYDKTWQVLIGAALGSGPWDCRTLPCSNTQGTTNIWAPLCEGGSGASSTMMGSACHNCGAAGNSQCPPFGCGDASCVTGVELLSDTICDGTGKTGCGPANSTFQTYAFSIMAISPGDIVNVTNCSDPSFNTPPGGYPSITNTYACTGGLNGCSQNQNPVSLTILYPNAGLNVSSGVTSCQVNNGAGFQRNFIADHLGIVTGGQAQLDATEFGVATQQENNQLTNSYFYFGASGKGMFCGGSVCKNGEASNPGVKASPYQSFDQTTNQIHHDAFLLPTVVRSGYYKAVGLLGSTICANDPTPGNCTGSSSQPLTPFCSALLMNYDANGNPLCLGMTGWLDKSYFPSPTYNGEDCTDPMLSNCPLVSPPWGTFDYHSFALCAGCGGIGSQPNPFSTMGSDGLQLGPCLANSSTNCSNSVLGTSMISIDKAITRKLYVCLGSCGTGPWPD